MIPKDALGDIGKKSKQEAAARQISSRLHETAYHKTATFELVLESWQPWSGRGAAAYRIKPAVEDRKEKGVRFAVDFWVFVTAASGPDIEKLKRGDRFRVTGKLTRTDFEVTARPKLLLDLEDGTLLPE